jgi:hypothetical protein
LEFNNPLFVSLLSFVFKSEHKESKETEKSVVVVGMSEVSIDVGIVQTTRMAGQKGWLRGTAESD